MPSSRAAQALRLALLLSGGFALGCGATGLDWVGEAHFDSSEQRASVTTSSTSRLAPIPATADLDIADAARPRLNRTITLGEVDATAQTPAKEGAAAAPGLSVTINNYNQLSVPPSYSYPILGYSRVAPSFSGGLIGASTSRPAASGLQPGQNWPTISDHGPSFPYHSQPSMPWSRAQ